MNKKLTNVLTKVFHWVFFVFVFFLFVSSLFVTATHEVYDDGGVQEFAKVTMNSITSTFLQLIVGIAFICIFYLIFSKLLENGKGIDTRKWAIAVSLVAFTIGVVWIRCTYIVPGADQALCVKYANAMNNGDFSALERGGYLATYQHLLGLVAFLRLLFRVFGEGNYDAYRYFSALCIPVLIYSGYKITSILSKKNKLAELFYLLLMLFCIPMYAYVLFVYGDLTGPAIGMLSIWMFLENIEKLDWKKLCLLVVSVVFSIILRKSAVIFELAMMIVLIVRLIRNLQKNDIILFVTLIVSIILSVKGVDWLSYPHKAAENSSLPAEACIAMSLNYDNGFAGWYNYYELTLHSQNGYYTDATRTAAREVIKTIYVPFFAKNPKVAVDFFFNKINSQWQSPLYQSIVSNNLLYGGQNSFVMSVYHGTIGVVFEWFMKTYQMLMYLSITVLLWIKRKESVDVSNYITMIAAFGGFLLSVIWEAKGRYILPYFLILIPIYAIGSKYIYLLISRILHRKWSGIINSRQ